MLRKKIYAIACFFLLFFVSFNVFSAEKKQSWSEWVKVLRAEAIAQGIRPALFDQIFSKIERPSRSVLAYDRNQPEKRLTFLKYRNTRADKYRIVVGRREYRKYKALLNKVSHEYGVSACFITSLWGLETSYGSYMGKFPVIQSLATLAYDKRRAKFFRKQLLYALHILNEGHVKNKDFKGEWAGASGHPQFLPSSWHYYAVDYNGDGKRDIWKTLPDVFASIANYLVKNGWQNNKPWAILVKAPASVTHMANKKVVKSLSEWQTLGVKTWKGQPWPNMPNLEAELIRPYGGPDILIFNNFKVIMKWNRSTYYAGTVGYLAEKICGRPLYH
jgi:membrane-bound lytic murein transglycosylase B